jgi:Na+/H+-dicarboxylate symporter
VILPFSTSSYGKNEEDLYCFIKTDHDELYKNQIGRLWGGVILYLPVGISIIFNIVTYYRSYKLSKLIEVCMCIYLYINFMCVCFYNCY